LFPFWKYLVLEISIVRLALTGAGQKMVRLGDEFMRDRVEKWPRRFTPQERTELVALMGKLVEALEEEL
jgi:hypothetical protein